MSPIYLGQIYRIRFFEIFEYFKISEYEFNLS